MQLIEAHGDTPTVSSSSELVYDETNSPISLKRSPKLFEIVSEELKSSSDDTESSDEGSIAVLTTVISEITL